MIFEKSGGSEVIAETLQVANDIGNLPNQGGFKPLTKLPFISINLSQDNH
jgi:hypothetical protein